MFYSTIMLWLLSGAASLFIQRKHKLFPWIIYIFASLGSLLGIVTALIHFNTSNKLQVLTWHVTNYISFHFTIDELSAFFILLICLIGFIVAIYSPSYIGTFAKQKQIHLLSLGFHLFLVSMIGVVTAANGFTFLVMWEMMSIVSFFLVIFDHEQRSVRHSGMMYVIMTHLGTGFIIIAFLLLFVHQGTLDFQ